MLQALYIYLTSLSILFILSACVCLRKPSRNQHLNVTSSLTRRSEAEAEVETSLVTKSASRVRLFVEHESHVGSFFLRLGAVGKNTTFLLKLIKA